MARLAQDMAKVLIALKPADPAAFLAEQAVSISRGEVEIPREAGSCGTEEAAAAYLAEHRIEQILEELMGKLLFEKPEDVGSFLREQLSLLSRGAWAAGKKDGYFTDDDLRGMFALFDRTRRGRITSAQALTGARSLGLAPAADSIATPEVDEPTFVAWARAQLDKTRLM